MKTQVRKGGRIPSSAISDTDLKKIFAMVDTDGPSVSDGEGSISIHELTVFVWGAISIEES